MVRGLDVFQRAFADWSDQYVLIGGTAAYITMRDEQLDFRATKDLDVVLIVEALTTEFGAAFWTFIQAGGYEVRQASEVSKRCFYRFRNPADGSYPAMIELFSRAPDALISTQSGHLTPIPFDEALSSLSAILLDEAYYAFIIAGRKEKNGLAWVDETRLIPLKASAWLEMRDRKSAGQPVDTKDIKKHVADVIRLSELLVPGDVVEISGRVRDDMIRFVAEASLDDSLDPRALGVNATRDELLAVVAATFQLN